MEQGGDVPLRRVREAVVAAIVENVRIMGGRHAQRLELHDGVLHRVALRERPLQGERDLGLELALSDCRRGKRVRFAWKRSRGG
jgi:hypothetical protein